MTLNPAISPLAADLDQVLIRTEGLWEALRGKAVFITGGTGFFGRWLLESFVTANQQFNLDAKAVVLTRHPEQFQARAANLFADDAIHLLRGDVRLLNGEAVAAQLAEFVRQPVSHFIHAAANTSEAGNRQQPAEVMQTLFEGTQRTLELATRVEAESFLFVSSGAVYGEQPSDLTHVAENFSGAPDLASPLAAYGEGKRVAEFLCHAARHQHGLNCKIARCFAFVGPYLPLDAHFAIGNFIRDALAGKPIEIKGDGTPFRSYLYAADLAAWLWTLLLNPAAVGAYNVGSDEAVSILETAECVSRNRAPQPAVTVRQRPGPQRPAKRYVPNVNRARELGLEVWTSLDEAVRKTILFHQTKV
jgi:dTDP-glucose 4,6-dehydratase